MAAAAFVIGAGAFVALSAHLGVSPWAALLAVALDSAGFLAVREICRWRRGHRSLVLLEHAGAAAACTVGTMGTTGQPLAHALDAAMIAMAAMLAVGRVGCLFGGCCHGRPAGRGVRYPWMPPWLSGKHMGVRLVPVQGMEALGLAILAGVGVAVADTAVPGSPAAVVAAGYAVLRFATELQRGDRRRFLGPLSHNQWSCLAIITVVATAGWPVVALVAAAAIALTSVLSRRRLGPPPLLVCRARALDAVERAAAELAAGGTSARTACGVVLAWRGGRLEVRGPRGRLDRGTEALVAEVAGEVLSSAQGGAAPP